MLCLINVFHTIRVKKWTGGVNVHLGTRLKKLREAKGLSQKEISHGIVSTSHYSNIESGRFDPSHDVLHLLANKLEVPTSYFYKIYEDHPDLQVLLIQYEKLLNTNEKEVQGFLTKHVNKLTYISSIKQEILFNLLKYLELVRFAQITLAQNHYTSEIKIIPTDYIDQASNSILEKYTFVTGIYQYFNREYKKSIRYFLDSLHLTKDEVLSAKLNYNISMALYNSYDYGTALVYAKQALGLYMHFHDWDKCGHCYNLIAALYMEQHKMEDAKHYIEKGSSIITDKKSKLYADVCHNQAYFFYLEKEYMQALREINRSLEILQQHQSKNAFNAMKLKVEIVLKLKDFKTLHTFLPHLKEAISSEIEQDQLTYLEATIYYFMGEYEEYEQKMRSCIAGFRINKDWKSLKTAAHHFSNYFAEQKKYKNAYTYQELCILSYSNMTFELKGGEEI